MSTIATGLQIDERRTILRMEPGAELVIQTGYRSIAETCFRHDPPTPAELESAIDVVEDALMDSHARRVDGGTFAISGDIRRRLPGLLPEGAVTTIEAVEARFQQLASASLGHPGALAGMPLCREAAAALLILRECMHHLGFARLMIDKSPAGAQ